MLRRPRLLATICSLVFALQACTDAEPPPTPEVALSDSLGVTIRTYSHQDADLPTHGFSPDPILQIGAPDGDGPDVFGAVSSLMLTEAGGVVVADELAGEIRVFSASGEHLLTMGSLGEGPGEFGGSANILSVSGDSILVWDQRQQRVSTFVEGAFATSWSPPGEGTLSRTILRDGRLFGEGSRQFRGSPSSGLTRQPTTFVFVDQDGSRGTVAEVDGHEVYLDIRQDAGQITGISVFRPPFARGAFFATLGASAGTLVIGGPNDRLELREWTLAGELMTINRYPALDRLVTDLRVERARERIIERFEEPTRQMNQELELLDQSRPEFVPAFDRLWEDDEDRLWIRRSIEDRQEEWLVLSASEPVARLLPPEGFALMQVREGLMIGRWQDQFDVAYVRVYELEG